MALVGDLFRQHVHHPEEHDDYHRHDEEHDEREDVGKGVEGLARKERCARRRWGEHEQGSGSKLQHAAIFASPSGALESHLGTIQTDEPG